MSLVEVLAERLLLEKLDEEEMEDCQHLSHEHSVEEEASLDSSQVEQ